MTANAVAIASPTVIEAIPDSRNTLDLVIYWRSIAKRKWRILAFGSAFALVAAGLVQLMTPVYRSTATLLVEQNKAKVAPTEEVYANVGDSREHFQTQAEILKARALAMKLVDKLDLTRHPDFDPRQHRPSIVNSIRQQIGWPAEQKPWTDEALRKAVIDSLMRRLTIEPVRLSQLIRVSFESSDPYVAADVANAIARMYIESDNEARFDMNARAGDWLGSRLAGLRKNLEDSERALQQYRDRQRIVETKGLAQSGATRQIEDLTTRLVAARQRRYVAEHAYQQVNSAKGQADTLPIVVRNALVVRLKELEHEAERRVIELSNRYGPEHPRMEQAEAELQQAKLNTRRQIDVVVSSLLNDFELARANEQALERSLVEAKGDVQVINRKEFQLASLERAVATNRQIYDLFLNRFRETSAARDQHANAVARVTDEARPSQVPIKPKKEQIVSIAFMLGIVFGALVALLLERLNNTLNSTDDVEEKLGEPLLTALPLLRGRAAKDVGRHYLQDPGSVFSEAIRTARTGVLLSSTGTPNVSVLVTSSIPDEGKTAVAVNLALAQAQTKRVLLVDADLRQPALGRQLGLDPGKPGLTDLLSGAATFPECLQRIEGTSLYVITTGHVPLNPLELLMSQRFQQLVKALASTCDVLILDSPPVHLVSDALVLSKLVSGAVFVVKADSTPYPLARRSIEALRDVDANIFGVMLNQLDFKKADRYYGAYTGAYYKYDGYYTRPTKSLSAPQPASAARS